MSAGNYDDTRGRGLKLRNTEPKKPGTRARAVEPHLRAAQRQAKAIYSAASQVRLLLERAMRGLSSPPFFRSGTGDIGAFVL